MMTKTHHDVCATIDIGTNSVLLLVAHWEREKLVVDRDTAHISRLGEGLHQSHLFSPEARKRTLSILKRYQTTCKRLGVKKVVAAGMSAFRRAGNGTDFLNDIGQTFGWTTRLLSGEEEARLAYRSVQRDFEGKYLHLYAIDIGGGSTEVISQSEETSLNLGSVILTETHLRKHPPAPAELEAVRQEIDVATTALQGPVQKGAVLVGLAGTVTTLSAIHQGLKEWTPQKIQGSILRAGEIEHWIKVFASSTLKDLKSIPGMVPGREDTMLAGTLILKRVMERLQSNLVIVSDRGVRYGLFYEQFS